MKTRIGLLSIASLLLLSSFARAAEKAVPPERAAAAREALSAWFACVECNNGELDRLLRYGRETEKALVHVLRSGPSPAKEAEIELELRAQASANGWSKGRENEYVKRSLVNFKEAYSLRAITPLARLGTHDARAAIVEASEKGKTVSIRSAAKKALESMPRR